MRNVLYILRKEDHLLTEVLAEKGNSEESPTVLLVQDAVRLEDIPANRIYALAEDAESRHITPRFPTVSYREMLDLIFNADSVVAL